MQSREVRINVSMQGEFLSGFDNEAFVLSSCEAPDDHLQSFPMTFLWIVSEASNLGDSMSDVHPRVVTEKQKHAHN